MPDDDRAAVEWEDGYLKLDAIQFHEQYGLGNSGSGARALYEVDGEGDRTGAYYLQLRFMENVISVRLTPADVGRLHEQALHGGAMFAAVVPDIKQVDARDIFKEFGRGRRPA